MDDARALGPNRQPVSTAEVAPAPAGRALIQCGYACNNRCVYCAQGDRARLTEAPPGVEGALAAARAAGADAVAFVGGEPTLHDELPGWVRRARELGFASVVIQTNGRRLVYGGYARALRDAGAEGVDVALVGPTAAIHEYHTRVPGSFAQSAGGVRAAVAAGLRVGITTVLTRSSYRHVVDHVRLCRALGAAAMHLALPVVRGAAAEAVARVVPPLALTVPHVRRAGATARAAGLPVVVSGAPLCALGADAALAIEDHAPAGASFPGRVWPAPCTGCSWRRRCPGLDAGYAERFGAGELRPQHHPLPAASESHRAIFAGFAGVGWVAPAAVPAADRPSLAVLGAPG